MKKINNTNTVKALSGKKDAKGTDSPPKNASHFEDEANGQTLNDDGLAYLTAGVLQRGYATIAHSIVNKVQALADMMQGAKKPESQVSAFDKIEMINQGISKKELEYLKEKSGLDYDQLSEVFSVARATLINKKGAEKFNHSVSEKIVSLADIYGYGYEVFEDEARFNTWIFRANRALGGKAPYYFLNNQYGREEIKNLIGRIDYGVYS